MNHPTIQHSSSNNNNNMTSSNDTHTSNNKMMPPNKFSFISTQPSKFSLSGYNTTINTNNNSSNNNNNRNGSIRVANSSHCSTTNNPYRPPFMSPNNHINNTHPSSSSSSSQKPLPLSSTTTTTSNSTMHQTQAISCMTHPDGNENMKHSSHNYNVNTHHNHHQSHDLESKLHETAASFRKSRDEAHRNHRIAQERLRIVQEEYTTVQTSLQTMQQHLQTIQETYTNDQSKYATLQTEVQQLSNEVRFQHAELVAKRNQLQEQRTTGPLGKSASAERQAVLDQLHHTIQYYREKLRSIQNRYDTSSTGTIATKKSLHPTILMEAFKEYIPEGQTDIPVDVLRQWIRLFEQSTLHLPTKINHPSVPNDDLQTLKLLQERYEEFIATNTTHHPHSTPTAMMSLTEDPVTDNDMDLAHVHPKDEMTPPISIMKTDDETNVVTANETMTNDHPKNHPVDSDGTTVTMEDV